MADSAHHDELINQLCELTGASPADAQQYLVANQWDLSGAATEYYQSQEEGIQTAQGGRDDPQEAEAYTGPRTLDGRPAPAAIPSVAPTSRSAAPPNRGKFATLDSLNQGGAGAGHGHGHAHDDDDDSDDEDYENEQPRDLFTGGEKSGLAVQDPSNKQNNPSKLVNDILKKARANAAGGGGEPSSAPSSSRFRGSGQTLGGDDTPSQIIPDPNPRVPEVEAQARSLHLWQDGFSVGDGPLYRFDDPANASYLQKIRNGQAPTDLMDVSINQPVNITLINHDENYKPPPKVYKPFSGGGHRLGSPTPGASSAATSSITPVAAPAAATSTPAPADDASQGSLRINVRLAQGQMLRARFNPTDTIGDIYDFIARAPSDDASREWVLSTTMPNVNHTDKTLQLGDVDAFKRGGVAIQKWV
ncbi:hypothetical protein HYFRA_00003742 [Hymenoscyphus fraxineus]|uniref:SEP-domain-containing protein n=1 Tax=Hymenoscyphus fraxineus TaxID=746836 RepID=A0A9N9PUM4_9HELO|nr:hypothetical protein HYFRA_00003742 [Hymenoscyphus fraxineus]